MIIKKLHIENFGKLQNITINLEEGLNEFYYENGFGKTTISIFLKAMFYGMQPARENIKMERKKYKPWQGGNFGGYIEFSYENILYRVTRFFGKTPEGDTFELLNMSTNKLVDLRGQELGETIFGVGKETFDMTAFFPQLNFSVLLNEQISANILGLDKFKYDLANLNTAISQIKKKLTEVKREKPNREEIESLRHVLQEMKFEVSELEKKIKECISNINLKKPQVLQLQESAERKKKDYELNAQRFVVKKKLEDELREKQSELNNLLLTLNDLNNKEKEVNIKINKEKKRASFLLYSLIILGLLGIICGTIVGVMNVSFPAMIALFVVSSALLIAGICSLFTKRKHISKTFLQNDEKDKIENKIALSNQQISIIKDNLAIYQNDENPNMKELESINSMLYEEKLYYQSLLNEQLILNQKLDNLVEKCDAAQSELSNKEELFVSTERKIELLTKTKDFLIQANENVSKRFVEPANKAIKEILERFNIRGREFVVDTNFDIKEVTSVGVKEGEYSSQGYQDILAFCVRIYLLKEIYKAEKPFIILDDTFVNLDDDNMKHAKEIIEDLERDYQIIYMCCNSRCKMK